MDYGLEAYTANFTMKDAEKLNNVVSALPVLLPHEIMGALFLCGWHVFSAVLLGGVTEDLAEVLLDFHWSMVANAPWAQRHPCFTSHRHLRRWTVPVRWHGDDASIKTMHGRKLCIFSVHSEFAVMNAIASRLLTWVCHDEQIVSGVTLHELMAIVKWSFDCMLRGTHPDSDHLGQPWEPGSRRESLAGTLIAGGYRFAFQGSLGDWAFHSKLYFPVWRGSSHNFICPRDAACRHLHALRHTAVGDDAGWRQTAIDTLLFLLALGAGAHPAVDVAGWDLALVRTDVMHCCFLGLFLIVCGNCFWELQEMGHFCPVDQPLLKRLNQAFWSLIAYCRLHRLKLEMRHFTPHTFSMPGSPELNSKACDCRIILGWLADECGKAPDASTERGKRIIAVTWWQHELVESFEQSPRYVVEPFMTRITTAADRFSTMYLSLVEEHKDTSPQVWKPLRKIHTFVHMIEDLQLDKLNPRLFGGWTDESLMGKVVRMVAGQHGTSACSNILVSWFPMFVEQYRAAAEAARSPAV